MPVNQRVQVAVPVSQIPRSLTYGVPAAFATQCVPGMRVRIPVGGRRMVGVITDEQPDSSLQKVRPIESVLDESPVVTARQLALCRFVAEYYLTPLGEALRLVLPPDTARDVKRMYRITERGQAAAVFSAAEKLNESERKLLSAFEDKEHKSGAAIAKMGVNARRLARLVERGLLLEIEKAATQEVRKTEFVVALKDGEALPARSPALGAIDAWLRQQVGPVTLEQARVVFPNARGKVLRLVELGRARIEREVRSAKIKSTLAPDDAEHTLSADQQDAVDALCAPASSGQSFLLEGVTGSGKTEVYLRTLEHVLAKGEGAILVVPEIALTPQLLARVSGAVGVEIAVLHSGLSVAERRDALARLREGKARVVLGARSALFAPMQNLGLIVVDEEHDASLKQDETPRYHGRDVALWRAKSEGAICVLGSATPSLESRHNISLGKLQHLRLQTRIGGGGHLPEVEVVDMRARKQLNEARKRDKAVSEGMPSAILSGPLLDALDETLRAKEQALLFMNRRGYASFLLCEACGEIRQCPSCSVSLTLHKERMLLLCHQCDHEEKIPEDCPSCGHGPVLALGLGTERIEAEVQARFPEARVARLDRDTARHKGATASLLGAVQRREVDVLIGTQMVAKGHDFPGITLVGVVLADVALAVPDFRAAERAFSLLTQVAGRAGRGERPGKVIFQTYNPEHPAIVLASEHDVVRFAEGELAERSEARYPPFWRAAVVRIEGPEATAVDASARRVGEMLRQRGRSQLQKGEWDVLGPAPSPIERLRGNVRHQIFLRTQGVAQRARLLQALRADETLTKALERTNCRMIIDVDPAHLL